MKAGSRFPVYSLIRGNLFLLRNILTIATLLGEGVLGQTHAARLPLGGAFQGIGSDSVAEDGT